MNNDCITQRNNGRQVRRPSKVRRNAANTAFLLLLLLLLNANCSIAFAQSSTNPSAAQATHLGALFGPSANSPTGSAKGHSRLGTYWTNFWSRFKHKRHKSKSKPVARLPKKSRHSALSHSGKKAKHRVVLANVPNLTKLKSAVVRYSPDAQLGVRKNQVFLLRDGEMLVSTRQPIVVRCGTIDVAIAKNVIALLSVSPNVVKVRNLEESHTNSVRTVIGGRAFKLAAGQEVAIANDYRNLGLSLMSDKVYRRQLRTFETGDGVAIASSEFAAISLLKTSPVLLEMRHSCGRDDKVMFNKIMKMTACLTIATASHGWYTPVHFDLTPQTQTAVAANSTH